MANWGNTHIPHTPFCPLSPIPSTIVRPITMQNNYDSPDHLQEGCQNSHDMNMTESYILITRTGRKPQCQDPSCSVGL